MDNTSLEGSPNTIQNSESSQVHHSPSPDPTKNLNNHFESVANQKYDSISELNKRGSMPSILHASHLDHDDIFVGEDDDFVFEVESPKLSNKMQMILQSNVNLSESIIQNTFKAVDASRIKLENRDLQVELEITELKLHHLEKKLEGCLQSSKSTLSMNAKLSENVSKILHSPSKRSQTMNLPEIKPRSSDSKLSPKTISATNENGSQFFRSAQGISSSSPQTSNRLPPSGKKQALEEVANANMNVNVYEKPQPQMKSQNEGIGIEGRTITGTSIENNIKRNSTENTPNLNLETYLDNLKNSSYHFTFNQNQARIAEELVKNMSSDVLQASIVDEVELLQNTKHISETKKMALPGLNFNILPHNAQNQQELPPPPYKAPPENNNYINTQDNISLDYSEITTTNIQPPSESRNVLKQHQQQDVFSQLVSQGPYGKQEVILEDANKNQIVYILKPKETLSFEKLEPINVFFRAPASKVIDNSDHNNNKVTLTIPTTGKQTQIHGVESEVESLLTTENIFTQSSPAKTKLPVIRESETGQNTSYSESQPAAENQQQLDESAQAMHLKLQLLNHPRCQKLLYGDDLYTVSNRGCSILQNRLESLDSGKKIITNRSDAYFKQKVHDFKNFLKEFEELLGSEQIIPPITQGSQQNSPQQPMKRLNSCDSERLNSGEAKILENILEKYFSSPQKQTQPDDVTVEQEQQHQQDQQIVISEAPAKEKKLKKKKSLDKKPKGSKQPKVILNTSNLSNMTNSINQGSAAQSPTQKIQAQSPLDKILSGSPSLTFKHIDMIANPIKLGVSSVKSDSIQFESTMKDTRKNSEVSTHIAETEVRSPMGAMVDYAQFSKLAKNPRSVSFASGKSSSMKTLPEQREVMAPTKSLAKTKATSSKNKISAKSSPKKSTSKPRSSSKTNKKSASTSNQLDVLSLLKPTGKKAKF